MKRKPPSGIIMMNQNVLTIFTFVLLLGGCAFETDQVERQPTASPTREVCEPSPILTTENGFSEIQGIMHSDGELWALLFFGRANVDVEQKIVWRITSTDGEFTVEAMHEDGMVIPPVWGPEYHEWSTWERPGEEWGTAFNFPKPGCWTLTATRGATSGEIMLQVFP
jgi:hypothetical protein